MSNAIPQPEVPVEKIWREAPPITIVMSLFIPPTEGGFSRLQGARQTLLSWGRHLKYPGDILLHIANDSTDLEDAQVVGGEGALASFSSFRTTVAHTRGAGLGGGFNEGVKQAMQNGPLMLYADDSYSLVDDLDLTPWARLLLDTDLGAISLMPPRPGLSGGICNYTYGIRTEGVATMIFPKSGYNWNGRPFLYHERFFEAYGPTPEHCTGYEWENGYSEHFNATPGPQIGYAIIDPWQHVWSGVRLGDKPPGYKG